MVDIEDVLCFIKDNEAEFFSNEGFLKLRESYQARNDATSTAHEPDDSELLISHDGDPQYLAEDAGPPSGEEDYYLGGDNDMGWYSDNHEEDAEPMIKFGENVKTLRTAETTQNFDIESFMTADSLDVDTDLELGELFGAPSQSLAEVFEENIRKQKGHIIKDMIFKYIPVDLLKTRTTNNSLFRTYDDAIESLHLLLFMENNTSFIKKRSYPLKGDIAFQMTRHIFMCELCHKELFTLVTNDKSGATKLNYSLDNPPLDHHCVTGEFEELSAR